MLRHVNVEPYLARIGFPGPLEPTAETLRALHERHMLSVPFENLDIQMGRKIVCDLGPLYIKIVQSGRGGFCYELNGLFCELLRRLGYEASMLSARVRAAEGGFGPEFDHMALLVTAGGERWLADVGFGDSFLRPLRLDFPEPQRDPAGTFLIVHSGGEDWTLLKDDQPEYHFTLQPRSLGDFAGMCEYHQTSPQSPFTRKRVCSMATADGRVTVSDRKLILNRNGSREEHELADEGAWRAALHHHFGIDIPEGST